MSLRFAAYLLLATMPYVPTTAGQPEGDLPEAAFRFTLEPGGGGGGGAARVRVRLECRGDADGATDLLVDETWGGVRDNGREIADLGATGADGRELTVRRGPQHVWHVDHNADEPLTVTYTLAPPPDRAPAEGGNDYRTLLTPTLFHMIGTIGLVMPERLRGEEEYTFSLAWEGFYEAGWSAASSLGPGVQARTVTMSGENFRHSLFMAGKIRCHVRELKEKQVGFAIAGSEWGFTDEQFVDLAMGIVRAEREFFDDHTDEWFLVTIVPTEKVPPGSLSLGGTGLTNCFSLFVNDGLSLEPGSREDRAMKHLLAHEYFHTWNGRKIRRTAPPEGPTEELAYWFSEGFTDFYARRLLLRAGLWDAKTAAEDLNSSVATYWLSPVRGEPNTRIKDDFWNSREVRELPYRRGDLLALAIDERIRQASGGARSLDDLMRELLERATEKGERVSTESLIALVASYTDAEFGAQVAGCVEKGGELSLPQTVTEPALKLTTVKQRGEDLGFDFEASREAKNVMGVRAGSAAHQAGLRDGQPLRGWSLERSRGDEPPTAKVEIEENGEKRTIEYTPVGEAVDVPRYEEAPVR